MVITRITLILILSLHIIVSGGCEKNDTPSDPAVAEKEAKEALKRWTQLLNKGQGENFLRACLPANLLKHQEVVDRAGRFQPAFMEKFYNVMPDLHMAIQEAQLVTPVVEKGNVVFIFPEEMHSDEVFENGRMYMAKNGNRWHFNGPLAEKYK